MNTHMPLVTVITDVREDRSMGMAWGMSAGNSHMYGPHCQVKEMDRIGHALVARSLYVGA